MVDIDWDNYQSVEGFSHLYRDKSTGAIINMDFEGFSLAKQKHENALKKIQDDKDMIDKVTALETDMQDIKKMLTQLLGK